MIHEQKDYDINKIPDDEPVFLLRGSDPHAAKTIDAWLDLHRSGDLEHDKRNSICDHADAMRDYYAKQDRCQHDVDEGCGCCTHRCAKVARQSGYCNDHAKLHEDEL